MYFRFLTARFAVIAVSAICVHLAFSGVSNAVEQTDLPTIEIHLEALDKFAPAPDLQNQSIEPDDLAKKKFSNKKLKKSYKPIVAKSVAEKTAPVKLEKAKASVLKTPTIDKKIVQKTEHKEESKPEEKAAQKAVDKAVSKAVNKEPILKDEDVASQKPPEKNVTVAPPVVPVAAAPIELPKPEVSAPALPAPVATEPAVSAPKIEIPAVPEQKSEELPKPKPAEMSAADIAEAQKALAPIAEIKPTIPAVPVVPDAPPIPAAPSAVDLTPLPPPPSPAGEMAAAIAPAAVPALPAVAEKVAEPTPAPVAPEEKSPEVKSDVPKAKVDLSISFLSTETAVPLSAQEDLKKLVAKAKASGERIALISYASGSGDKATTARRVSLSRALAVRAFLIEHDIDKLKINVQAEGDKSTGGEPDRVDMFLEK